VKVSVGYLEYFAGAYAGGFLRFQENPFKTTKTNKIMCPFRLAVGIMSKALKNKTSITILKCCIRLN
jgi:hypothetical protein